MLVLDLDKPEELAGSLAKWTSYINDNIIPIINEVKDTDSTINDYINNYMPV